MWHDVMTAHGVSAGEVTEASALAVSTQAVGAPTWEASRGVKPPQQAFPLLPKSGNDGSVCRFAAAAGAVLLSQPCL